MEKARTKSHDDRRHPVAVDTRVWAEDLTGIQLLTNADLPAASLANGTEFWS
jgi:hypothetical protein